MKIYQASYYSDGPGAPQSGYNDVFVVAPNKKAAVRKMKKWVVEREHSSITVKRIKSKKAFILQGAWIS